jgi:hypothetical protein
MKFLKFAPVAFVAASVFPAHGAELTAANCPKHYQAPKSGFKQEPPAKDQHGEPIDSVKSWSGLVTGWYRFTLTGIKVKEGDEIRISANGTICWETLVLPEHHGRRKMCPFYFTRLKEYIDRYRCVGPKGQSWVAPGLWAMLVSGEIITELLGWKYDLPEIAKRDGEIVFMIQEGPPGEESTKRMCRYYGDNCGSYDVKVAIGDRCENPGCNHPVYNESKQYETPPPDKELDLERLKKRP